ncbi:lycopene cyclase domain-containing protein [bacterium]|nr:MAG: lycopene cyclase domain-containing protein [bacterium]
MIENWYYLFALVFSISGLTILDWRYKLAFWVDQKRATMTIAVTMLVFIIWDLLGIRLGIFFHGGSDYTLPVRLLPEFPIEELFFLFLLCYVTLLLYTGGHRLWARI